MYKISVVIRVYNEQKHIREVLESLKRQTYRNHEVIILDSESTDDTLKIASEYECRIEKIKKKDFNYSYASNVCVNLAQGDIVVFLSGHSVPVKTSFLEDIDNMFKDSSIGAAYGDVIALPDGSFTEKAFNAIGYLKNIILRKKNGIKLENEIHPGIFSCSNACARRELLLKHPFAPELGDGGEDVEVAYRIIQDGYYIASNPDLLVMHSHGKKFKDFIKEYRSWKVMYNNVLNYISC
ncbi:Glycosyl transferase family 2 [Butyrivibrio sp. Su6]|uniref:glycosyltransferase n=1 Tax=Butyrivibrio sp. Su6 TaxID=1520810 RepID=UPI00089EF3D7|nr:glycosyltransferase [Butyrivibrio sp. Su6]SEG19631.1 Glycosyl transferase family 2 [Butyrivibrio sp. Su6]